MSGNIYGIFLLICHTEESTSYYNNEIKNSKYNSTNCSVLSILLCIVSSLLCSVEIARRIKAIYFCGINNRHDT